MKMDYRGVRQVKVHEQGTREQSALFEVSRKMGILLGGIWLSTHRDESIASRFLQGISN